MNAAPPRRWFRFSLRTLFVVVTILCCWMAYELNWIRQRHQVIDDGLVVVGQFRSDRAAPGGLWLFGETGCRELTYTPDWASDDYLVPFIVLRHKSPKQKLTKHEFERIRSLFPEATLLSITNGKGF